jgi:putative nucleotidyltransferase-like protein
MKRSTRDTLEAAGALRMLLDDPRLDPDDLDWTALRRAAVAGGVIVRLADRFARRGETVPPAFGAAAVHARTRAEQMVMLVDRIGAACRRHGVAHAFLKITERYPDAGSDLDLLVEPRSADVDHLLLHELPATPRPRGLRDRLTGATTYQVAGGLLLDIHHGRLGQFGERAGYAQTLLGRVRDASLPGVTCRAPVAEDHLLVQALHQVYTRPTFRLADAYWTITVLRHGNLRWEVLLETARGLAFLPGLEAYVRYMDRVHHRLFATQASGGLRFPDTRLAGRLYLRQVRAAVAARDWGAAARLCSLPVFAAEALWRRKRGRPR